MTDSTRYIIGNCIIYIGFGFLFYALYLALCEVIDISLNPLGMEFPEEKEVKKEKPKNLFETDKVFWDMMIAATGLLWLIIVVGCIYGVLANA